MIDVLSTTQLILRAAGFSTRLATGDGPDILYFEDSNVMGFGRAFETPAALLSEWRTTETALLTRNAQRFRAAGEKAWNVYLLLLTASSANVSEDRHVRWIEEDLERTRKLAACGLVSRDDLTNALLPILPIQSQPSLLQDNFSERLHRRIRAIAPRAADIVLTDAVSPEEVVRLFGGPL
jgi:hypothetical protein